MKVLTYNTWGIYGPPERQPVLAEAIRKVAADFVCLQEAVQPGLLDSLGYPSQFYAKEGGLAILSRFPARSHREITYRTVSPLEPYRRQALLVELQVGTTHLWVVNTHLAWKAEDEATRLAQIEELLEKVTPLAPHLLLSGDFNASPEQAPIRRLAESGFRDLFATLNRSELGITWDNRNPYIQSHSVRFPDRRIDYLFLHADAFTHIHPRSCQVVCRNPEMSGLFPSDHYGVLATLDL